VARIALMNGLEAADLDAVVVSEVERQRRRVRHRRLGRLAVVADPSSVAGGTRLRRVVPVTVIDDGDTVVVEVTDRRLRMPGFTAAALRMIADRDAIHPGELPGLGLDDGLVLVRRLVREGVLSVD
jgi:hypothetical protein